MRIFFTKNNHWHGQLLLLLALNLLSGFILYGKPLAEGRLYWDILYLFSFFRDNLNSLNYFGEIAWWNPNIRFGLPLYYLSILGHSLYNPFFVCLAVVCWLLGVMNIHITSFAALYSIYVVFIIPFLFSLGGLLLARRIFRSNITIAVILLLAGFSPGVVMNLSEDGLLLSAWSLFFAAAFLGFMKSPSPSRFWALCLSGMVLALSFNHIALYWTILFIPLFSLVCLLVNSMPLRQQVDRAVSAVPKWYWAVAAAAISICLLPAFITFMDGADLVRTVTGTRWYPMEYLRPGNPLEPLSLSSPAIGFYWDKASTVWKPFSFFDAPVYGSERYLAFTYLGILSLPLVITGLLYGRHIWRLRLLVLLALSSLVIILSAYSPVLYLIMFWEQPLRAVDHYSDMFFRLGMFYLLILAAGLGFEVLLRGSRAVKQRFLTIFTLSVAWSLALMLWLYGKAILDTPLFGFAVLMILFYAITLAGMNREKKGHFPYLRFFLVALMAIDIATVATWHVRHFAWTAAPYNEPAPGTAGLPRGDPGNHIAQGLLEVRQIKEQLDAGADPSALPPLGTLNLNGNEQITGLSTENARILEQTYNTATIESTAATPRHLFWRDAYFPGWKATVNGAPAEIINVDGFKAVAIPQGRSETVFRFSPGMLPYALLLAYAVLAAVALLWWRSRRTDRASEEAA